MVNHSTYGMQLNVESYEKTAPKTEKAMELYLASGVLKGIGPKTSAKIVKNLVSRLWILLKTSLKDLPN